MTNPEPERIVNTTPMTAHDRWLPVPLLLFPVTQARTNVIAPSRLHSAPSLMNYLSISCGPEVPTHPDRTDPEH